jgi:predicted phosphodiesterase
MRETEHSSYRFHRRDLLKASAGALPVLGTSALLADGPSDDVVAFFLVGDTHYLANSESPGELDERSRRVTSQLVNTLNTLPGTAIPAESGGGKVRAPRGVIHAGDLIDNGDKAGAKFDRMQRTEWDAFTADFTIDGSGALKYPVFEVHGNHDAPRGKGLVIDGLVERNRRRKTLAARSENGLHCSWDWAAGTRDAVHFVNLGIVVGQSTTGGKRRYEPLDSLAFLKDDLAKNVGDTGRRVVITHHIDVARYSLTCEAANEADAQREWHPCDVQAFYQALSGYNVAAILYGHTHARNVFRWEGKPQRTARGYPVFNVDNSSHFASDQQAFFYFELHPDRTLVRECSTADAWTTHRWTPQVWTA